MTEEKKSCASLFTGHVDMSDQAAKRVRFDVETHTAELTIDCVTFSMSREAAVYLAYAIATVGAQEMFDAQQMDFLYSDWYRANPRPKVKGPSR